MDLFLFQGKHNKISKKPINLGGAQSTFSKADLFQTIQHERQIRQLQRDSHQAAVQIQFFFRSRLIFLEVLHKLADGCLAQMNEILLSSTFAQITRNLRLVVFARQVVPESFLLRGFHQFNQIVKTQSCDLNDLDCTSFLYLSLKYALMNCNFLHHAEEFCRFFFANYSMLVAAGFDHLLFCFVENVLLSEDVMVGLLENFKEIHLECLYEKYLRCIHQKLKSSTEKTSVQFKLEDKLVKSLLNETFLVTLLKFLKNEPSFSKSLNLFPLNSVSCSNIANCIEILQLCIEIPLTSIPQWIFFAVYFKDATAANAKYFDLFCKFIDLYIINSSAYLDVDNDVSLAVMQRLRKFGLPDDIMESTVKSFNRLSYFTKSSNLSFSFICELLTAAVTDSSLQLCVFSLFWLYLTITPSFYEYHFEYDAQLSQCIKRFHHPLSSYVKLYAPKCILLTMVSYLDRENCIREFQRFSTLFPPSTCIVSAVSGLSDVKHLQLSFSAPFEQRMNLFKQFRDRETSMFRPLGRKISVRRGYELEDALSNMQMLSVRSFLSFEGESGFGIGVMKEFITNSLSQALTVDFGLFQLTSHQTIYPSSSSILPNATSLFQLTGKLVGLALIFNVCIESKVKFDFAFLSSFRHPLLDTDDLYFVDSELYKNLAFIAHNNVNDLSLTFSTVSDEMEGKREIELIPNGASIAVTEENKGKYIELMAASKLNISNINAFLSGLHSIIPHEILVPFNEAELCMMVLGLTAELDLNDWESNTVYSGPFTPTSVTTFWQAVHKLSTEEQTGLLRFATGCPRPPLMGFQWMKPKFTVVFTVDEEDKLPQSHTCFNMLVVPKYSTVEICLERLKMAIANLSSGFLSA